MSELTIQGALETGLALSRRRVLSDWRAAAILFEAEARIPESQRRWRQAPSTRSELQALLTRLVRSQVLQRFPNLPGVYEVCSPYAQLLQAPDEFEILFEAHPLATVALGSALVFHGLTDTHPRLIHLLIPDQGRAGLSPPGMPADQVPWEFLRPRTPARVLSSTVHWQRTAASRLVGLVEIAPRGYPIRVTSLERTLLDALSRPDVVGGWEEVLRVWRRAWDRMDPPTLEVLTDQLGIRILRQRVGVLLERLGYRSARLDRWAEESSRGGSSKLHSGRPFSPHFDPRWNLSLNAPLEPLDDTLA